MVHVALQRMTQARYFSENMGGGYANNFNVRRQELSDAEVRENAMLFNEDIGSWNMDKAVDLEEMIRGAQNLSASWGIQRWNTSNVQIIKALFIATKWTGPMLNLGDWDVSNCMVMDQLFR